MELQLKKDAALREAYKEVEELAKEQYILDVNSKSYTDPSATIVDDEAVQDPNIKQIIKIQIEDYEDRLTTQRKTALESAKAASVYEPNVMSKGELAQYEKDLKKLCEMKQKFKELYG